LKAEPILYYGIAEQSPQDHIFAGSISTA